jgi:hypothetical protein
MASITSHCPIAILDIGGVHLGTDQQTTSIGNDVAACGR